MIKIFIDLGVNSLGKKLISFYTQRQHIGLLWLNEHWSHVIYSYIGSELLLELT